MNLGHLAISYDNKLFIPVDVPGDGDCLYRSLIMSDFIPDLCSTTFRSNLSLRTKALLNNDSSQGRHIRNYFNNNEKSLEGESIENYIDCTMGVSGKWGSTFEMICVSIIYGVRIISIANMTGGFLVSDTLSLLNAFNIDFDYSAMLDRYIYLYCHLYKAPTTPCPQDIQLNHFAYLEVIEELPKDSKRQIYFGDSRENDNSVKIEYPSSFPSYSDDTFSPMVSSVSASSQLDNQFCHIVSPYSMIINSNNNDDVFDSSKVNEISGNKKRKLISNSNDSMKLKLKKGNKHFLKKGSRRWNEKKITNCRRMGHCS